MDAYIELPQEYKELEQVDLQKDKKMAFIVNGIGVIIMVIAFFIGHALVPITELYRMNGILPWIVIFAGTILYMVLHELVHVYFLL